VASSSLHGQRALDARDARFTDNRYSRRHAWHFDGGAEVAGSSSPQSVPVPYSDPEAVDRRKRRRGASSCHMLFFLSTPRSAPDHEYVDDAGASRKGRRRKDVDDARHACFTSRTP
jgi:hypothetical protein